jgi:hypothetical protein
MKKIALFFIITNYIYSSSFAQSSNDAGLWATFNIEKKVNKKLSLFVTEEYRMRENFTRTNLFYTDIGISVKPLDFLKISLAYRCIEKFQIEKQPISFRHRGMLDITFKKKIGKITASYRQRIQSEIRNVYSSDIGMIPEWYSRNKFEIKYDIDKPVTPYIAAEFRYQINNPRSVESNNTLHRNRYFVGLDYKKSDKHSFGLFYMVQREYNVSAPQNLYIVGLEYGLSL